MLPLFRSIKHMEAAAAVPAEGQGPLLQVFDAIDAWNQENLERMEALMRQRIWLFLQREELDQGLNVLPEDVD